MQLVTIEQIQVSNTSISPRSLKTKDDLNTVITKEHKRTVKIKGALEEKVKKRKEKNEWIFRRRNCRQRWRKRFTLFIVIDSINENMFLRPELDCILLISFLSVHYGRGKQGGLFKITHTREREHTSWGWITSVWFILFTTV